MFLFQCVKLIEDSEALSLLNEVSFFISKCLAARLHLCCVLVLSVTENKYLSIKLMVQFGPNCTADT